MLSFFYKLFPVDALIFLSRDSVTAWGILIILLIFFCFWFKLKNRIGKLTKALYKQVSNFSEEQIGNDIYLKEVWNEYSSTFQEALGSMKTDESASNYFNSKKLFFKGENLSLISSAPNLLTGLGVLGTFTGLTLGISDFNTENTETIKSGIQMLLSGMGSAFATSIWGMLLSLVLTFYERTQINKLSLAVHALNSILDKKYKLTRKEESFLAYRQQESLFLKTFSIEDSNGNLIGMPSLMIDLKNEFAQMNHHFEEIYDSSNQALLEELKQVKAEVILLRNEINAPALEMTQHIVEELKDSLGVMMEDFRKTMSSSALSELDELAKMLNTAGKNMADLPARMEDLSSNLDTTFGNLRSLLVALSDSSLGQQVETIKSTQVLLQNFSKTIQQMDLVHRKIENSMTRMSSIHELTSTSCSAMAEVSTSMRRSSDHFLISQENFGSLCESFLKENERVVKQITSLMHTATENALENENRFETIRSGLHDIFSQIEEGLVQYQGTVGSSIRSYLSEFTQHLTSATSSLASESSKQADLLEELNEMLSKLRR